MKPDRVYVLRRSRAAEGADHEFMPAVDSLGRTNAGYDETDVGVWHEVTDDARRDRDELFAAAVLQLMQETGGTIESRMTYQVFYGACLSAHNRIYGSTRDGDDG